MNIIQEDANNTTSAHLYQLQESTFIPPSEDVDTANPGTYDLIIIGGGPAGLTAGIYASRDELKTLILEGELLSNTELPGGQLMLTPEIENFPGFASGSGDELIEVMREQAVSFGAEVLTEQAIEVSFEDEIRTVATSKSTYSAKSIIIATGAVARRLGVVGEEKHFGRGVSVCATCDGAFFRDQTVAVIGGGDTAVEDALFLTRFATHVNLIVRKDKLRTNSPEARALLAHPQVTVIWNTEVKTIIGEDKVESVELYSSETLESSLLPVTGVFVAIGHDPATKFLEGSKGNVLEIASSGYLLTKGDGTTATSIPGVFAAGDVADEIYRQAITAAGSGCKAALDAERWLIHEKSQEVPKQPVS